MLDMLLFEKNVSFFSIDLDRMIQSMRDEFDEFFAVAASVRGKTTRA